MPFFFWFAVPETMVTRFWFSKGIFWLTSHEELDCFFVFLIIFWTWLKKSWFDLFWQIPASTSSTSSLEFNHYLTKSGVSVWMIRTFLLGKLVNLVNPTYKTWAIPWTSRVLCRSSHPKEMHTPLNGSWYAEELSFVTNVPRAIP